MAAAGDVRDILDLGRQAPGPKFKPKKKSTEAKPRASGLNRELQGLMGDSVPPVQLTEAPKYKSKPQLLQAKNFKPRHWEQRSFTHGARSDGLTFRHWKRAIPGTNTQSTSASKGLSPTSIATGEENKESPAVPGYQYEEEFPSEKWNVKVQVASYTDEQYSQHLKADDWTRSETDYLMNLCREYDLRWILIADRYVPDEIAPETPELSVLASEDAMIVDGPEVPRKAPYPERSMEALKSRYYTVAAKMLALHNPPSNMTQDEFNLWEKMKNFDAKTESTRKALAEKLFERTKEEAEEEKLLLEELHRITRNEEEFLKMRKELYDRLDPAPSKRSNGEEQSTAMYQTSSGLSLLLQTLLQKEKRFKRPPSLTTGPDGAQVNTATPGDDRRYEKGRHSGQFSRRETLDSQGEQTGPQKKGSQSQPHVRTLTPEEELKFGVSHPQERLTGGVSFRHDRISKITTGKSQIQTQKLQQALIELGVPARLVMPTEKVCREFEKLVGQIQVLLDLRKTAEKVGAEVKVLEEMRRIRLGLPKDGEPAVSADKAEAASANTTENVPPQIRADDDDGDAAEAMDEDEDAIGEEEDEVGRKDGAGEDDEDEHANEDTGSGDDEEREGNEDEDAEVEGDEEEVEEEQGSLAGDAGEEEEEEEEDDEEEEEEEAENQGETSFGQPREEDEVDDEADGEEDEDNDVDQEEGDEAEAEDEDSGGEQQDMSEAEQVDEDSAGEEDAGASAADDSESASELSRPPSSQSAGPSLRKRSASVLSEGSKAGSNRSGLGRKKRK